ncbi:MAG: hypothetical protein LC808_22650 [Actinobacteria bacterium]|nr:hypothetical protein [Actinomycetota bacterium]
MQINCHVPIAVRMAGEPTQAQLEALGHTLARTVAARLAKAEQVLTERHRSAVGVVWNVEHLDEAMMARQEQRSQAAPQGRVPGEPSSPMPDPFGDALREALAEAMRNPPLPPPDSIIPGDRRQQVATIPEVDALALWKLPRIQDALRRLAERQRTRTHGDPTKDANYYMNQFRIEFANSLTYILQRRETRRYKGKPITVRDLRLVELQDAEANLAKSPPPDRYGAQNRAFWAMGAVMRAEQARRAANEQWQKDIERAATQFLVLARNQTDFLSIPQHATPVKIFGLPEWLEGTVPASANPDLVEQDPDNPGSSPTVIRFLTAVRREYSRRVIAINYPDHEKSNMYVGDIAPAPVPRTAPGPATRAASITVPPRTSCTSTSTSCRPCWRASSSPTTASRSCRASIWGVFPNDPMDRVTGRRAAAEPDGSIPMRTTSPGPEVSDEDRRRERRFR